MIVKIKSVPSSSQERSVQAFVLQRNVFDLCENGEVNAREHGHPDRRQVIVTGVCLYGYYLSKSLTCIVLSEIP